MPEPTTEPTVVEPETTTALEAGPYAPLPIVRDMALRITEMLPSAAALGPVGALALAQVAVALELNPFTGELWAWKNKDKTITLMVGIKGLRRAAHAQARLEGGHYQSFLSLPSEDDLEGVKLNPGDIVRCCTVTVWTDATVRTFELTGIPTEFEGIGICRAGDRTRMEKLAAARKRAEADALKQAFDLPVAFSIEEPGAPQQFLPTVGTNGKEKVPAVIIEDVRSQPPEQEKLPPPQPDPRNPRDDWDAMFNKAEGNPFEEVE